LVYLLSQASKVHTKGRSLGFATVFEADDVVDFVELLALVLVVKLEELTPVEMQSVPLVFVFFTVLVLVLLEARALGRLARGRLIGVTCFESTISGGVVFNGVLLSVARGVG